MQTFKHTLGALALAALALTGTAQAQTVNNGTFDTGLVGWTTLGSVGYSPFGGTAVFDSFTDRLRQTISGLVGNQTYLLSFSYSSSTTNAFDGLTFDFNGAAYNPPAKTLAGTGNSIVNYTTTFVTAAGGGNSTLIFRGANGAFSQLDNVSITAVPEPETYAMLLAGLGAIGFMSRRRKNLES